MSSGPPSLGDGRYELLRRIGRGGSGQVWLARDHRLERDVAIKRVEVPGHLPDDERAMVRERIRREARAAARIDHAGVAPLFDVVSDGDTVDLVMTYIDAPDLAALVRREGPLDETAAAQLGLAVLDVLEAAHAQGVVHRDVKPSNVLVGEDAVHLTDFGIAALSDETAMTRTGTALGSPGYIAPEQAQGRDAAPEADLWGLGTLLYHAVTGRPPFDRGRPIATMHAVVHDAPDPIDGGHPLAPLIGRLLRKDPVDRPSTSVVRRELERVAAGDRGATDAVPTQAIAAGATQAMEDREPRHVANGPRAGATERLGAATPPPRRSERGSAGDRRGLGALLVAAAVVAVLGGVGWALLAPGASGGDGGEDGSVIAPGTTTAPTAGETDPASPPSSEAPSPSETGLSVTPSPEVTTPGPSGSETGEGSAATVAEGWDTYEWKTDTVAHPAT